MPSKVAVSVGFDRRLATRTSIEAVCKTSFEGKTVTVIPDLQVPDPAPASTHDDTLLSVVELLTKDHPRRMAIVGRSRLLPTAEVFLGRHLFELGAEEGFECLALDDLPEDGYVKEEVPGSHWRDGFRFPRLVQRSDRVICLGCLKTHAYGERFSMMLGLGESMLDEPSLRELHDSQFKEEMIADLNYAYSPAVAVLDCVDAFFRGGPTRGSVWRAGFTLASTDRLALDAVGVAALKLHGTTKEIEQKKVFEQRQIKRAVELGLGAHSPDEIELVPLDRGSEDVADKLAGTLRL
jgi:uncharacterized protein (DUF362 family)